MRLFRVTLTRTDGIAALARRIAVVGMIVFALDRASKIVVLNVFELAQTGRIDVAPPYLTLLMAWNRGVNFGIGGSADARWMLIGLAVVVSIGLVWWVLRTRKPTLAWGCGAVVGGALGNAWDRFQYGAVADFLNMSCCGIVNPYAFNIADIAIFAGAAWIAIRA
jgi:signal peptidase II